MLRRIHINQVPTKRGASKVTQSILAEFEDLKRQLKMNPLGPYEVQMLSLEDVKGAKPTTLNHGMVRLLQLTKQYIAESKSPYNAFTRKRADGLSALYVVGREPAEHAQAA